jgi:hypothetical protein
MVPPILRKNAVIMLWNRLPAFPSTFFLPFNDNDPTIRRNVISADDNAMWNSLTNIQLYKIAQACELRTSPDYAIHIFMQLLTEQSLHVPASSVS